MFIDTGKQARVVDESGHTNQERSPPQHQQPTKHTMTTRATEPELGTSSASHPEATQSHLIDVKTKQQKRVPDENIAKLVAEENESKSKFPHYPGLERWELVEKMGDGAFSNVYRARDREGGTAEVAIKVVRKFEMNSMQVRCHYAGTRAISRQPPFPCLWLCLPFLSSKFPLPTLGPAIG